MVNFPNIDIDSPSESCVLSAIEFINELERQHEHDPYLVYQRGNCGDLYKHLSKIFGDRAQPYFHYDGFMWKNQHILTRINGRLYDQRGRIKFGDVGLKFVFPADAEMVESCCDGYPYDLIEAYNLAIKDGEKITSYEYSKKFAKDFVGVNTKRDHYRQENNKAIEHLIAINKNQHREI